MHGNVKSMAPGKIKPNNSKFTSAKLKIAFYLDTLMLSEALNESLLLDYDGHSKELKGNIKLGK